MRGGPHHLATRDSCEIEHQRVRGVLPCTARGYALVISKSGVHILNILEYSSVSSNLPGATGDLVF